MDRFLNMPSFSFDGILKPIPEQVRRKQGSIMLLDSFPMELTTDILSRLPMKSLCRFKTVSKKLCYLIEDPDFIKYHRSRQSGNNQLLLVEKLPGSPANPIHSAHVNNICHGGGIEKVATTTLFDKFIGCCDGLACLLSSRKSNNKITMINISTRENHTINYNKSVTTLHAHEFPLGFGYDSIHDDYKMVFIQWINRPEPLLSSYKPKIYSLKTCKWTTIAPTIKPYLILSVFDHPEKGVFLAASLHSFAIGFLRNLIAAFNLETLTFHTVHMPYKLSHIDSPETPGRPRLLRDNQLSVLGGLLCVAHFDYDKRCTDIWVMEEYKVTKSWSNRFSVPMQVPIRELVPLLPLAYSESGDKILMESNSNKCLYWFDYVKEQVSKVDTIKTGLMLVQVFTPSLVRLGQRKQNVFPKKRHLKLSDRQSQSYKKTKQWRITKCEEASGTDAHIQ